MTVCDIVTTYRYIRSIFGAKAGNDFSPIVSRKEATRALFPKLWRTVGYIKGAEIGVWRGSFSWHILTHSSNIKLYCIDPWEEYTDSGFTKKHQVKNYKRTKKRLRRYIKRGRAVIYKQYSEQAVRRFYDGELDFVFIDGHHSFDSCMLDLIKWSPKVRKGGMIAVHDYCPARRSGVIEAVNVYTKCHNVHLWHITNEQVPTAFWIKEYE